MKKLFIALCCIMLILTFSACSGGNEEKAPERPPAFSILQKQTTLTKRAEKGKNAAFNEQEFADMLGEKLTYITVTDLPEADSGALIFNGASVMKGQSIPSAQLNYLKFIPTQNCAEASFGFTCDSTGYNGSEMKCVIVFGDGINSPPVATDSKISTVSGITVGGVLDINEPNGDEYIINVITYPTDGAITLSSDGSIVYTPNEDFSGKDKLLYTVTDRFGAVSERAELNISVEENESGIRFADMENDMSHLYAHKMCASNVMVYRYENGSYYFDPDLPVSKMDFLVMLMNVTGQDADIVAVADSAVSDDTALSSGLKGYLSAANEKGIIRLTNGKFSPFEEINIGEAAYMINASLNLPDVNSSSVSVGVTDKTYSSLAAVKNAGITDVTDPSQSISKAEAAKLLCSILDYMEDNNVKLSDD